LITPLKTVAVAKEEQATMAAEAARKSFIARSSDKSDLEDY
jgi:hypothetical protein